jgi:hypothetical protein
MGMLIALSISTIWIDRVSKSYHPIQLIPEPMRGWLKSWG